jgi:hypothetical protein
MRGLLNAYVRILIVSLAGLLCMTGVAAAQSPPPPVATASQSFGFDYKDSDLSAGSVVRFEMAVDAGTFSSIQIPAKQNDSQTPAGSSTYVVAIPALVTGPHTVSFRACNAQVCGDASAPFSFVLAVKPATPSGTRIK